MLIAMLRTAIAGGLLFATAAYAEEPKQSTPCVHGASQIMLGGVDPVEQACTLALAGRAVAEQAQELVVRLAQVTVARNDLAAMKKRAEDAEASLAAMKKRAEDAEAEAARKTHPRPAPDQPPADK